MATGQSDGSADRDASAERFDREFWDGRWSEVLREHAAQIAERQPERLPDGDSRRSRSGASARRRLWERDGGPLVGGAGMARHRGRLFCHGAASRPIGCCAPGPDVAQRIAWVEGDLGAWIPESGQYDLVVSLFVHVPGSVVEMVTRLADGVAPGGTMLLVGHLPIDPVTGAETPAAGQVQVTVEDAVAVLDAPQWELLIVEDRERAVVGSGFDAVICAHRRT